SSPDTTLHVVGKLKYQDGTQGAGKVLTSDANGNASWGLGAAATGWALNGTHLYNTNTGNVGVGTTTATSRLHVAAPYNHGTTLNLLQSTNSWGTPAWFNAHRYIQTNYAGNPAEFKQFNVGGGGVSIGYSNVPIYGSADALYVSGRVGLGTTAPDAKLTLGTPGQTWTDYGLTSDSRLGVVNGPGGRLALILTSSASAGVVESFNYASGGYAHTLINPNGGNVGIGTSNPTQKLTVAGDVLINGVNVGVGSNPANSNCGIGAGGILTNNTTGKVNLALGHAALYYNVTGHGNVGVGAAAGARNTAGWYNTSVGDGAYGGGWTGSDLLVESPFTLSNSIALGHYAQPTADNQARIGNVSTTSIGGSVGWSNFSDGRFKTDVRTDEVQGLSFITRLTPVTYRFDQDLMSTWFAEHLGLKGSGDWSSKRDIESIRFSGFIAQDVERVAAEVGYDFSGVDKPKNAHDHYSLRYAEFVVPLVKAVQELDERTKATDPAMLNSLLDRLTGLEAENARLQHEMEAQRSVLEANTALMLELQGLLNSP
ncbi:MAG: tail fiber domain-containing protein, partial [Flavobacteriales bacterium]|nr:tail fiber domain-containing protein [Flavobacteriales bacterium]